MRKCVPRIDEVKAYVRDLTGRPLKIAVNKGRKKVLRYRGSVLAVYPRVFTLKITDDKNTELLACSYNDIICGDLHLHVLPNAE